jgi:hypothetical protein
MCKPNDSSKLCPFYSNDGVCIQRTEQLSDPQQCNEIKNCSMRVNLEIEVCNR